MTVQEHKAFRQILVNNEDQRISACERILKAHGIDTPVWAVRRIYQNIIDRPKGTPRKELAASWEKAQHELVKFIENFGKKPDYLLMTREELSECLLDACFTLTTDPLFSRISEIIRAGADVKFRDSLGNLAFRYLVVRFDSSQSDEFGNTVLKLRPIVTEELLRVFLEAGLDINEPCEYHGKKSTFWISLAGTASLNSLKMMIEYGARINDLDSNGHNALMECRSGSANPDCIKLLLANDAESNIQSPPIDPGLHLQVIIRGNGEKIQKMIENGSDVNFADNEGNTALHSYANSNIDPGILNILLENGSDVNARNNDGNSPLHIAADRIMAFDTLKVLIENEADVNSRNNKGNTPLHIAALQIDYDTSSNVEFLLENGADPDLKNSSGKTPLMLAAERNREIVVQALIKHGADKHLTDAKGFTAFDIAISAGFPGLAGIIESKDKAEIAFEQTDEGKALKKIKNEIISKLKAGFIFETGDKESHGRLSWVLSPVSPGYRYFISDLGGSSFHRISSDEEALDLIFSRTRRGWGVESEKSVYENALARLKPGTDANNSAK
ncbi:MAG: ankyrin repeat domain-containing protein [Candidatus Rifleibacteriota bacterium]